VTENPSAAWNAIDEKAREVAVDFGDEAGVVEVVEEQPRQDVMHRSSPPVIDNGDDAVIVSGFGGPHLDVALHAAMLPAC